MAEIKIHKNEPFIMHGLYYEDIVDYLAEPKKELVKEVRQEKVPQQSIILASSLKDLIKKLTKPNI